MNTATLSTARFDLKLDSDEKTLIARAAALLGVSMTTFARTSMREKAQALVDRESRVRMSEADFASFVAALDKPFTPNAALQKALNRASTVQRA